MRKIRLILATLAVALVPTLTLQPAANADWGSGYFTYNEWLSLHSGQTKAGVEATCNCSGTWANYPGTNPKEFFYDNTVTNGEVEEFYVYQDGHWKTFGSYWCSSTSCQKDF